MLTRMSIMYETVTTPFLDVTIFSTYDVPIIKKPVPRFSSLYMLPSTMSARRTPNSGLVKGMSIPSNRSSGAVP